MLLNPLPSTTTTGVDSLLFLAPSAAAVPRHVTRTSVSAAAHEHVLAQVQRLRGEIYLHDGAITEDQLTADGRHVQAADASSWHIVALADNGEVAACMRYRTYSGEVAPERLGVWRSALARASAWSGRLRQAIAEDIQTASRTRSHFSEIGGWAVAPHLRGAKGALMGLWPYALAETLGGGLGVATATARNCSAEMLKRMGGRPLSVGGETLPAYFDPDYGCEMEILRFDSRAPADRYRRHVERLVETAANSLVICAGAAAPATDAARAIGLLPLHSSVIASQELAATA